MAGCLPARAHQIWGRALCLVFYASFKIGKCHRSAIEETLELQAANQRQQGVLFPCFDPFGQNVVTQIMTDMNNILDE